MDFYLNLLGFSLPLSSLRIIMPRFIAKIRQNLYNFFRVGALLKFFNFGKKISSGVMIFLFYLFIFFFLG